MIKSIPATDLEAGHVLALPMGKQAHVRVVKVGNKFVHFKTEYGLSKVERTSEVLIESDEEMPR
jgi:hypothetical protein